MKTKDYLLGTLLITSLTLILSTMIIIYMYIPNEMFNQNIVGTIYTYKNSNKYTNFDSLIHDHCRSHDFNSLIIPHSSNCSSTIEYDIKYFVIFDLIIIIK